MGHYDDHYERNAQESRNRKHDQIKKEANNLGVPTMVISYTVIGLCMTCGGKIHQIDKNFPGAGQIVPCGCR